MFLKNSFSSVDDDELFGLGEGEADGVCARAPPADKKIASVIMPKWQIDILLLRMVLLLVMDGFARRSTMRSNRISICHFGIITLAIFLSAGGARAQTPSASPSPSPKSSSSSALEKDFFKNILRDQKAIWTAPFHLHRRDARYLAPLGLGTAALFATDQKTGDEIAEPTRPLNASHITSHAGPAYGVRAVTAIFY